MRELAIETADLTKFFQDRPAVNALTMRVPVGGVCGFLGRNGAGKTTTIKLLMGMLKANTGTVSVLGIPLSSASGHAGSRSHWICYRRQGTIPIYDRATGHWLHTGLFSDMAR
jgi:ABC-type multidrug transport system ATPase subunit